jgi:hypothetical protein
MTGIEGPESRYASRITNDASQATGIGRLTLPLGMIIISTCYATSWELRGRIGGVPLFAKGQTMQKKLFWPVVAIVYAVVMALGIYLGHRDSQAKPAPQAYPVNSTAAADTDETLVFVTRTGTWYHRGTCRDLQTSRIPVKLGQVRPYCRPCPKCRPQR